MRRAQAAVKGSSAWLDSQLRVRKRLELLGDTVRRDLPKVDGVSEAAKEILRARRCKAMPMFYDEPPAPCTKHGSAVAAAAREVQRQQDRAALLGGCARVLDLHGLLLDAGFLVSAHRLPGESC